VGLIYEEEIVVVFCVCFVFVLCLFCVCAKNVRFGSRWWVIAMSADVT